MSSRRDFLGAAGAVAAARALGPRGALGANDRIRIALIGAGGRGSQDLANALRLPNTQLVAVADVFDRQEGRLKRILSRRGLASEFRFYRDYRSMLADKSIDAVIIATPQHLHGIHFVAAIEAGKDVYQEKTMAFDLGQAKRMRAALAASNRIAQIGIQSTSGDAIGAVRNYAQNQPIGQVTALTAFMYRDHAYGGWRRTPPPDCTPAHVDWDLFQGDAPRHPFSAERFINWRFFWDYSGGNCFENMVHQVGFWYKALGLEIPESVSMTGGNYFSPDMQPPDTMNVCMKQDKGLIFNWNSGFGSAHWGIKEQLLGFTGTILRADERVQFVPNHGTAVVAGSGGPEENAARPDIVGNSDISVRHMANFLDCVRDRRQPNCPMEIGFRSAIACRMAVTSYRENRVVRWDKTKEVIV